MEYEQLNRRDTPTERTFLFRVFSAAHFLHLGILRVFFSENVKKNAKHQNIIDNFVVLSNSEKKRMNFNG